MRRIPLLIILIVVLGAGAAAWWFGSADVRRVSACREAGVRDQARLARCAEGIEVQAAVLADLNGEQRAEIRRRVRIRLAEVRASERSAVDRQQYERLPMDRLLGSGYLDGASLYESSEIPAGLKERPFVLHGVILGEEIPEEGPSQFYISNNGNPLNGVEADIERLQYGERVFIRNVCGSPFIDIVYSILGCPVVVYGRLVFKPILEDDWVSPWLGDQDLFVPTFRVEAVEFLDPPQS